MEGGGVGGIGVKVGVAVLVAVGHGVFDGVEEGTGVSVGFPPPPQALRATAHKMANVDQ